MREVPLSVKRINKNDMFIKLIAVQLAVCAVLGAVIGAVYKLNRELFGEMKSGFEELMSGGFDLSTGVPKLRIKPAETTQPGNGEESTEKDGSGKNGDKKNDPEDKKNNSDSRSDTAQTEKSASADAENPLPAGGVDLSANEAADCFNFGFYEADETPCLPVSGNLTSGFGKRVHPIYGTDGFHSGLDIAAPKGTPILAALDGTVCEAGTAESAGNYVKLSHDGGLYTLYCHMNSLNTEKGVKIRKGDVIGFVGETGLATGPHLHFEVQREGEKLDPSFLLEKAVAPN